ncbi:hypothetical protein I3843_03G110800 [Carya illinoinensis]|nr:hypothetical protein I3843_03G110800 [Carya illinoinensis]
MKFQQWIMVLGVICASFFQTLIPVESHPVAHKIKSLPGQTRFRPGCSSIGTGAFIEHGPFRPSGYNLVENEYSWNKETNMLYLESPAGVGFSYSSNKSFYSYVDDEITAQDSLLFLKLWFAKFPEYQNRDFFIAGESYTGHYVPQLAHLIVQSNVKFKLKGIAIETPLLEFAIDFNAPNEYYWSHGLISDAVYSLLSKYCNSSLMMREAINGGFLSPACTVVDTQLSGELSQSINIYYVIGDVCEQSSGQSQVETQYHPLQSRLVRQSKEDVCAQENIDKYLNKKDVQQALHARLDGGPKWVLCSNGDQDSVVPFTGTRTLVHGLAMELGLETTVPYRAWFEGKQVGGWTQLPFANIRGASHTAPASQPERSLMLFKGFIAGQPLPAT